MRIAELSRRSGVPVPTIKYYLRENLLPPGEFTSPNQAQYDERHLQRLRLVRALLDLGRLPIAAIKELLAELDRPSPDLHHALGRSLMLACLSKDPVDESEDPEADRMVAELIERRGWQVDEGAPARRRVAEVIAAFTRLGVTEPIDLIDEYAEAVDLIANADLEVVRRSTGPDTIIYNAVVGTVLGDALLAGLRRLAQESASAKMFGATGTD
jgi:DNA-binding transcriptional MerR regulator